MGYSIGICGLHFGRHFAPLFQAHPLCSEVVLCDVEQHMIDAVAKEWQIAGRTCRSFDELVEMDVDAIAIFTPRWMHGSQSVRALRAGKHVYSAVPAGVTGEELHELVDTVQETGLTYALGETSYYRPQTIWCRQAFAEGRFGDFVYGEGQYYHHIHDFCAERRERWRERVSIPPIWYQTHSAAHVLSVTFSRFTKVCAFGWRDRDEDGLFDPALSEFDNPFSNQTALYRTADGGSVRINEFRRSAAGESRQSIIGTTGAYEEQGNSDSDGPQTQAVWTQNHWDADPRRDDGSYDHQLAMRSRRMTHEDLTRIHEFPGVDITASNLGTRSSAALGRRIEQVNALHPVERLPEAFLDLPNGHAGSHQFLVQDFMEAMHTGTLPPNHVWLAARYSAGCDLAHRSCLRDGELLDIPDFGRPPADAVCIDPLVELQP